MAKLEFALAVVVAGVAASMALSALSGLQSLGHEARRVTLATELAAASATRQVQCLLPPRAAANRAACASCNTSFTASPQPGSAPSVSPVPACPPPPSTGVSP